MSMVIRTDVTSVKFYHRYILAGIGSYLHVFSDNSSQLQHKLRVLNNQKIYGIVPSVTNKILIFGGKQITIVIVDLEKDTFTSCFEPILCDDWFHSGIWVSNIEVAMLTAHNVVEVWNTETQCLDRKKESKQNSILYSGLLLPLQDGILVLSGTVFSDILISCTEEEPLYYLKGHKGVIFSISCDLKRAIIVTTSDDRSVRIWCVNSICNFKYNTKDYWRNVEINCTHELYGHGARVMRNCIINDYVVSVGEDSGVCFWDLQGKLLRKVTSHNNASIWSVDGNKKNIVTGGGDGAVFLHPLSVLSQYDQNYSTFKFDIGTPKKVVFTAKSNIVVMTDCNKLIYHDLSSQVKTEFELRHDSTYKLLSISSCKQLIAVADMLGKFDVFIENCKEDFISKIIDTKLDVGKIMSMHWAGNRHIVFCAELGRITVLTADRNNIDVMSKYDLPQCKERWLTAVAMTGTNLIVGDRCGNLHVYAQGEPSPVKTFKHIHGRYGPTSINIRYNEFITTGREGTIKYFSFYKYKRSRELDFQWVEKFVDSNNKYICGFQERTFVVYDVINNVKVLEVDCGGGHRSWDIVRYIKKTENDFNEFITFMYIKESIIHTQTFQLDKIASKNIVTGTHSKEINCLKAYKCPLDTSLIYFISGGEDTTLRITSLNRQFELKDELILRHLSSIRSVKIEELDVNSLLVVSAGGRAQICVKKIIFEKFNNKLKVSSHDIVNYMIKGTDKERNESRRRGCRSDFDPETRVMDLDILSIDNVRFNIFAGCSDGTLRTFELDLHTEQLKNIECRERPICILKTKLLELHANRLLITATTFRELRISDVSKRINWDESTSCSFVHKSGVNSVDTQVISDSDFLLATGGDDNAVLLNHMRVVDGRVTEVDMWTSSKIHCSQVTGVILIDNLLVSASIDQRVTVFEWSVADGLQCEFKMQVACDVADVQGIELVGSDELSITVCVFGKGIELIVIPRPVPQ